MKQTLKLLLLATVMAFGFAASAQAQRTEKQRISREQLAEKQAKYIAGQLALDEATSQKFTDTYRRCQAELWERAPKPERKKREMTDKETEQELKARFEKSRIMLEIRQKYYEEYSQFLTQKQIMRVYELEKEMMSRLAKHKKQRGGRTRK